MDTFRSVMWDDGPGIDRRAAAHLRDRHRGVLRELITSVPLPDAVRLAQRYGDRFAAGHDGIPLPARLAAAGEGPLALLAAADEALVVRASDRAAQASVSVHKVVTGAAAWLSFGVGAPVLTLTTVEPDHTTRITMLREGAWHDVYRGPLHHHAVACIDEENVIAVLKESGRGRTLVHYSPGNVRPVAQGVALTGMRPAGTAAGFVAGSALQPTAVVAGPRLAAGIVDLSPLGLDAAHRLAVAPDGHEVAFGGERDVVVTDARAEHLIARTVVPVPNGPVGELVFTGPDTLVACGAGGGLSRWRKEPHEALTLEAVGHAPPLGGLCAIPAWGVVAGHAGGEGRYRFFDPDTLVPADVPRPLRESGHKPRTIRAVTASADGRFAAVGVYGGVAGPTLTIHDFHHPQARLLRPLASLTAHDLTAFRGDDAGSAPRDPEDLRALALLRELVVHRSGT
ncbi:hypothetical protein ACIQV3_32625 [Streptomyces sp. NPDC099050]|uniref:hypothetical protein n=1 Tax=Streptomyces sp. NPDC099050 TaxID=3366100 RepID=UPI003828AD21